MSRRIQTLPARQRRCPAHSERMKPAQQQGGDGEVGCETEGVPDAGADRDGAESASERASQRNPRSGRRLGSGLQQERLLRRGLIGDPSVEVVLHYATVVRVRLRAHATCESLSRTTMKIGFGILGVALVATLGDYTWYTLHVRHTMLAGVIHGAVLLTAVGAVLGLDARRVSKGLPIGALAGVGGALAYYLLVAVVDRRPYGVAIPAAWVTLWLLLAVLDGRWLRAPARRSWPAITMRGVLAAVFSGVAFFLVMNTLWGRPPATAGTTSCSSPPG